MSSSPFKQNPLPPQQAESSVMGKILAVPLLCVAFSAVVGIAGKPFVSEKIDPYLKENNIPDSVLNGVKNRNIRVYNNDNPLSYIHGAWVQSRGEFQLRRNADESIPSAFGSTAINYLTSNLPMAWEKALSKERRESQEAALIHPVENTNIPAYLYPPEEHGTRSYLARMTGIPVEVIDKKFTDEVDPCITKFQWGHEVKHADQFTTDIYATTEESMNVWELENKWESEADQHGLDVAPECKDLHQTITSIRNVAALTMNNGSDRGDYFHLSSYFLEANATGQTPPSNESLKTAHENFVNQVGEAGAYATNDLKAYWHDGYIAAQKLLPQKTDESLSTKMLKNYTAGVEFIVNPAQLPKPAAP
jgi:hypothetical protein